MEVRYQDDEEDYLAIDFDDQTNLQHLVYVVVKPRDETSSCAREAEIITYPNGTMVFKNITVDQPKDQMLSLMHRVIDDFEQEWAPQSFQGKRWSPKTRPRYTRAVPSKISYASSGREVPARLPPGPVDP